MVRGYRSKFRVTV